jgi:hypothetical protein
VIFRDLVPVSAHYKKNRYLNLGTAIRTVCTYGCTVRHEIIAQHFELVPLLNLVHYAYPVPTPRGTSLAREVLNLVYRINIRPIGCCMTISYRTVCTKFCTLRCCCKFTRRAPRCLREPLRFHPTTPRLTCWRARYSQPWPPRPPRRAPPPPSRLVTRNASYQQLCGRPLNPFLTRYVKYG